MISSFLYIINKKQKKIQREVLHTSTIQFTITSLMNNAWVIGNNLTLHQATFIEKLYVINVGYWYSWVTILEIITTFHFVCKYWEIFIMIHDWNAKQMLLALKTIIPRSLLKKQNLFVFLWNDFREIGDFFKNSSINSTKFFMNFFQILQ